MKSLFEEEDIQSITSSLLEKLKPFLCSVEVREDQDAVYDKKGLAAYLKLSESTVSKMVSDLQIPFFKIQAGQSGGVRFRKKEIDKWITRRTIPVTGL